MPKVIFATYVASDVSPSPNVGGGGQPTNLDAVDAAIRQAQASPRGQDIIRRNTAANDALVANGPFADLFKGPQPSGMR